ncbi:MAG: GspMb/PilO family protein [Culicoidibacterales bacterium]
MKMSKQEQILLSFVAILVISLAYYQFGFKPQQEKNVSLTQQKVELEQEIQQFEETIATIETKKVQKQQLGLGISQKTTGYYEKLNQEQIILDINKLLSDHKLTGKIEFTQPITSIIEADEIVAPESVANTLQQQIDQYNEKQGTETPAAEEAPDGEVAPEATPTVETVEQMSVKLSVEGEYKKVQDFIKAIETYSSRMIITQSSIKALADKNVTASLQIELYAIPSLESKPEAWGLTGEYGKDEPFSTLGSAFTQTLITADENKRDFIGIVKSSYSDLSSFMLAKEKDEQKSSYLVDDTNGTIEASMRFSQVDGKYVYSQTVGEQTYPAKGQQEAFIPQSNYIIVELTSEALVDSRDTTKLKLKIENKTDKTVVVFVRGDDKEAPRIEIEGVSETVVVVKQ